MSIPPPLPRHLFAALSKAIFHLQTNACLMPSLAGGKLCVVAGFYLYLFLVKYSCVSIKLFHFIFQYFVFVFRDPELWAHTATYGLLHSCHISKETTSRTLKKEEVLLWTSGSKRLKASFLQMMSQRGVQKHQHNWKLTRTKTELGPFKTGHTHKNPAEAAWLTDKLRALFPHLLLLFTCDSDVTVRTLEI